MQCGSSSRCAAMQGLGGSGAGRAAGHDALQTQHCSVGPLQRRHMTRLSSATSFSPRQPAAKLGRRRDGSSPGSSWGGEDVAERPRVFGFVVPRARPMVHPAWEGCVCVLQRDGRR
ncbi:hypothetical protein PLESTF_000234500 [Pleodorina starrii]|nr:hypothetical protein PLESTF_000234500 [Pleodorina starrii]